MSVVEESPLTMEDLYIYESKDHSSYSRRDIENFEWLALLLSFKGVKNLYLSRQLSPRIAPALQVLTTLTGRIAGVLPVLQNVLVEAFQPSEPVQEGIAQFISARQFTNHPISISVWDRDPVWDAL